MADALSRVSHTHAHLYAISTVHPVWLEDIIATYAADPRAQALLQQLSTTSTALPGAYTLSSGLIRIKGAIWIGAVPALHEIFFHAFHTSPIGGILDFRLHTYAFVLYSTGWA